MPRRTRLPALHPTHQLPHPATILLLLLALAATAACHTATGTANAAPETPAAEAPAAAPATEASPSEETPATEEAPEAAPATEEAAAEAEAEPAPETYKNTIKWSTASEVDNFGFDVYRGDGPEGPFERINADTIEGAGTIDEPTRYQYADDTIDPHRTYYYYVESISMSGVRERFTPVGKAGPKIKPEVEAEPEGEAVPEGDG